MINYIYYKLYQAVLKSSLNDIPEFIAPVSLGALLSANFLVLNAFLAKIDMMPFLFSNKYQGGLSSFLFIILCLYSFREEKRKSIISKYFDESKSERIKGNLMVAAYVSISFLSIFLVAFFRPGKL